MAVKIRLKRLGKKKQPFYRIVVADSRAPRDGRSIEKIGHYNPITDPAELVINEERLFHWMDEGATPSDTVFSLLRGRGLTLKYELLSRNADEATINKEMQKWELAQSEKGKKKAAVDAAKLAEVEAEKQAEAEAASKEEVAEVVEKEPVAEPTENVETEDSK
ncbi:MAG: 30S ribosomal protein S16 [Candidatus Marinimicrobia bacterium]|nr:30S ribosomal protein S16 [Candidatus Neomarinimicrobiota bacterium]